jgi:hypothetical protein
MNQTVWYPYLLSGNKLKKSGHMNIQYFLINEVLISCYGTTCEYSCSFCRPVLWPTVLIHCLDTSISLTGISRKAAAPGYYAAQHRESISIVPN